MALSVQGLGPTYPESTGVDRARPIASGEDAGFGAILEHTRSSANTGRTHHAVAPSRTPLSGSQAAEAIRKAYVDLTGEQPSQGTLAILTSHWALETGQGKSMYNFNFAGIKGSSPEGLTAVMSTREGYGDTATRIKDGFRAYTSADAGAKDYVALLQRRYGSALEAARNEQPGRFAQELKTGGYYTGDPVLYAKGVTQLANQAMARGFDTLGTTAGVLSQRTQPLQPYFDVAPSAFSDMLPYQRGSAQSGLDNFGLSMNGAFEPNSASVDAVSDEMSRTALLIAAKRGAV